MQLREKFKKKGKKLTNVSFSIIHVPTPFVNNNLFIFFQRKEAKARRHRSHRSLDNPGSGQTLLMQVIMMLI